MTARWLVAFFASLALVAPVYAQNSYGIAGIVVQRPANRPVKSARVTITRNEHPGQHWTVVTAEDGRFSFSNLARGKYSLAAQYRGRSRTYQQHDEFSTGIVVGPSLDSANIIFALPAPAGIAVAVKDQEGEPVANAQIILFEKRVVSGWDQIVRAGQGNTDSSGAKHFAHLSPGTYFVAATGRPWYVQPNFPGQQEPATDQQRAIREQLDVAYPVTYYSGALDALSATPITVTEGNTAQIEITLTSEPALQLELSGNISMPQFWAIGPGGVLFNVPGTGGIKSTSGDRELTGIAPGQYVVSAARFQPGPNVLGPEPLGSARLDMTHNAQLDASQLANTSISGQISFDRSQRPGNLAIVLVNVQNSQIAFGQANQDGSFQMRTRSGGSVQPGRYEIRLADVPGLYIKSIAAKGMNYSNGILEVQDGASAQLSVTIAAGETTVNGIALEDGKPASGALVLLVPEDKNQGTYMPRDQSDSDGTFGLRSAHPGRYTLIAIDDGSDLAYQEPGALKPYLAAGKTVDVPLAADAKLEADVQKRVR